MSADLRVLFVCTEAQPFVGDGPISEFCGELPQALRKRGVEVTLVMPFYRQHVDGQRHGLARRLRKLKVTSCGEELEVGLLEGKLGSSDVKVWLLDHPPSFDRPELFGFDDDYRRCHLLAQTVIELISAFDLRFDIVHINDWETGLLPLLCRRRAVEQVANARVVHTIHRPRSVGLAPASAVDELDLGRDLFHPEGIEFYGEISLLKAGLMFSDRLSTSSSALATEMQSEPKGGGLYGLFAKRSAELWGVANGVAASYNPAVDRRIAAHYSPDDQTGKQHCKRVLQEQLGLPIKARSALVLACSDGVDDLFGLIESGADDWFAQRVQFVFASPTADTRVASLAARAPEKVAQLTERDDALLRRVLAGVDALMIAPVDAPDAGDRDLASSVGWAPDPSLVRKALRYGVVPILQPVGALSELAVDFDPPSRSGLTFVAKERTTEAFGVALDRLLKAFESPRRWEQLCRNTMGQSSSWVDTADRYEQLYRKASA